MKRYLSRNRWLLSLSDLLLLLLTFLALRVAYATPNESLPESNSTVPVLEGLVSQIAHDHGGFELSFDGATFFAEADKLSFSGEIGALGISRTAIENNLAVYVVVTTPASAIEPDYYSGWLLAQARALTLIRQFVDAGVPSSQISAEAYQVADSEYPGGLVEVSLAPQSESNYIRINQSSKARMLFRSN